MSAVENKVAQRNSLLADDVQMDSAEMIGANTRPNGAMLAGLAEKRGARLSISCSSVHFKSSMPKNSGVRMTSGIAHGIFRHD